MVAIFISDVIVSFMIDFCILVLFSTTVLFSLCHISYYSFKWLRSDVVLKFYYLMSDVLTFFAFMSSVKDNYFVAAMIGLCQNYFNNFGFYV
jgi:hypothetical protein